MYSCMLKGIESDIEHLENVKENIKVLRTVTNETHATLFVGSRQLEEDSQKKFSQECL